MSATLSLGHEVENILSGVGASQVWLLFLMRTLGFVVLVPLLSARNAPSQFRWGLVAFLSFLAFGAWAPWALGSEQMSMAEFVPVAVSELVIGMMIGFITGMVFVVFQFAGQFIGYQMGFAIVNVLDPHSGNQVSLIGEFLFAVVMLVFLNLNLHHDFIRLWFQSYDIAPPGEFMLKNFDFEVITDLSMDLMILALKIALPLLCFLLLTDLSLGIIARVMPQMNVFIVGIPLKISLGLLALSLVIIQFDPVVRKISDGLIDRAGQLLYGLMS